MFLSHFVLSGAVGWVLDEVFSIVAERSVSLKLSGLGLEMWVRTRVAKLSREFWCASVGLVGRVDRSDDVDEVIGGFAVEDGGCSARGFGSRLVGTSPVAVGTKVTFLGPEAEGGGVAGRYWRGDLVMVVIEVELVGGNSSTVDSLSGVDKIRTRSLLLTESGYLGSVTLKVSTTVSAGSVVSMLLL